VRLAVYTDYPYHRLRGEVYAQRAFALFLGQLRRHTERLLLVGRLSPDDDAARYPVGEGVELLELPYYASLGRPWEAIPSFARSIARFWRSLGDLDCVWLLGPHPLALAFALCAALRGRHVVLGVRQDMPTYVRARHPDRPPLWFAAWLLELAYRALGLLVPVAVVGPDLARRYRHSRNLLELTVSLVRDDEVRPPEAAAERDYEGDVQLLSVGRLEEEKNPLLLAEVLALLNRERPRFTLVVCGEGELEEELRERLAALGQAERARLLGYVRFGPELTRLYRESHALVHTSWTEGFPAVLPEAFAAALPVVAADVGGIAAAVGDAALLVPPGDAESAASALRTVVDDPGARERLVRAGWEYARVHTLEAEIDRLAGFLGASSRPSPARGGAR
jgi:glycosyltransferase involved in cell wall biosynthesis